MTQAATLAVNQTRIISILDLGSNSLRMVIARVQGNRTVTVLNQVKHMVRLGENAFTHCRLQAEAMERTLLVLHGFAEMCTAYCVEECLAMATAAVRDATNGQAFLHTVREQTGFDFTIISGKEEARLIYWGIASGLEKSDSLRQIIDIGGGSTELVLADATGPLLLESLKIGCVRLANQFFAHNTGVVSTADYAQLQNYIRNEGLHFFKRMAEYSPTSLFASSGTAQNLAEIAAQLAKQDSGKNYPDTTSSLSYRGLCRVVHELCARTEAERAAIPGINPRRTGVLLPGAAILQTVMEELSFDTVNISSRGLRDGVLEEYLDRIAPDNIPSSLSIRETSVLRLAHFCHFEEGHSRHVANLALRLFDSARSLGLHSSKANARELLYYAALLHDIGIFIAYSRHNAHSHYLISNTELLGFTGREITQMAAMAFFHRVHPSKKQPIYTAFEPALRAEVRLLSLFLAMAEALEKSHRQVVRDVFFDRNTQGVLMLHLHASAPCPVELERIKRCDRTMLKCFGTVAQLVCHLPSAE
jgi:exopolyphosphatase / guanosine-5'-triphosphate,3'-diphosphate pyrophosphatase